MTDIRKHAPRIIQCIREQLLAIPPSNHERPAVLRQAIFVALRELLPVSYGIGVAGVISNARQQSSEPLDIIIYDASRPAVIEDIDVYPLSHVLMGISLCLAPTRFAYALEEIASMKRLKGETPPAMPAPPTPDLSTRNERLPRHVFPLGIIFIAVSEWQIDNNELVDQVWHPALVQQPAHLRPDYIFVPAGEFYYRNRTLDCQPAHSYDIGWLREAAHTRVIQCYGCQQPFFYRHFFYARLCPACGDLNYTKRKQQADLRGRVALVTGARVKIGYAVALKLLRAGATVIATTRFPHDAARRFALEADFAQWRSRLKIYSLDLRNLMDIAQFIAHMRQRYPRLDILVNNAAQTVRRPHAFYAHLLPFESLESRDLPEHLQPLLGKVESDAALVNPHALEMTQFGSQYPLVATLAQIPVLPGEEQDDPVYFPPGQYDADGQQVDLRTQNSWTSKLEELSLAEMLEVQLVNLIAPTLLIQQLLPFLSTHQGEKAYIINVAALEGQFVEGKNGVHPHTNMAKAALNMLTHTTASSFAEKDILMNNVDPGWISHQVAQPQYAVENIPLDEEDAAARICDPIFASINDAIHMYGKLLKDYHIVPW